MDKEIITLGDIEIEKHKFSIFLEDVDIKSLLVSNKISSGEKDYKYFIGYLNDNYRKTKWMHFLIEDDALLEKYNTISDKVSAYIKK